MKNKLKISDKILLFPLWVITLLPLRALYLISDFIYLVLYYLVKYRRKVVDDNLRHAFPEKKDEEIQLLSKQFFHHLCDYFIESIYVLHMSKKELCKRYRFTNTDLIHELHKQGRSFILATSHQGNWEWAISFSVFFPYTLFGIYKPLSNKVFDRLFIYIREKFGSKAIPMKHTLRVISDNTKQNNFYALYMVSDQRPGLEDLSFWTTFMNRETPVITGIDKLARRYNLPVVFCNVEQARRGYYTVGFELLEKEPVNTHSFAVSEKYMRTVEKLIRKQPELYLWSHKRWKYKPEVFKPKVN